MATYVTDNCFWEHPQQKPSWRWLRVAFTVVVKLFLIHYAMLSQPNSSSLTKFTEMTQNITSNPYYLHGQNETQVHNSNKRIKVNKTIIQYLKKSIYCLI